MDSSTLLTAFRTEMRDTSTVPFFSDEEIYSYIDETQKLFCRLTGGIADATSAITQVTCAASVAFVAISPLILKLRQVSRASDYTNLDIFNFENIQFGNVFQAARDYGCSRRVVMTNAQGTVQAVVTGMEPNKLRLIDIPAVTTNLSFIVYRLPLRTIDDADQALEIDPQHHRPLLVGMKALALQKQDAETFDFGKASEYDALFRQYCDRAAGEKSRREHTYRTVSYGGI